MRSTFRMAVVALGLLPGALQAATIDSFQGDVHVNAGAGFQKLDANSKPQLVAGSRVMVAPKGVATIKYANDCSVRVPSGIWEVQAQAPCPQGVAMLDFTKRMNQSAPPPDDTTTSMVVIGGLVVAGGAGAAILLMDDNGGGFDRPFSP